MITRKTSIIFIFFFLFTPIFHINAAGNSVLLTKPIKILLVPGHDNEVRGAQYGNMKEADMTLTLATKIFNLLKKDKRFEVYITRDGSTPLGYTKEFNDYFTNHEADILTFKQNAKAEMQTEVNEGVFIQKANTPHVAVNKNVAIRLYGINKWADENNIDAVIHIHFDDYVRANKWVIGKYAGFTVYLPDSQFSNAKESSLLANNIFAQLHKKYKTSNYEKEKRGLISDQKLIAIGANDTLKASVRSVLIEYGYIYEKKFRTSTSRLLAYKNMAQFTVTGIQNSFFKK